MPYGRYFFLTLNQTLDHCVSELDDLHSLFSVNPESDFSRNRKISFQQTIRFMIGFQSKSLPNEVMDYFGHSIAAPTKAAFIQQRDKILVEGWEYLFHSFQKECYKIKNTTYKGYRLLACDGSDSNIYRNPLDEETFIKEGNCGYNMIHINALYDLLNHTYVDLIVQGKKKLHERKALNTMVDRYSDDTPVIFIADRGYESFNTFAHMIEKDAKFIIRVKDIGSNGILSSYDLSDTEFDEYIRATLTRRHTKLTMGNPNTYTILQAVSDFDYLDQDHRYYDIEFRIVRFLTASGT